MTTRAVLPEDAGPCVFMLLRSMRSCVIVMWLRAGYSILRRSLRERNRGDEQHGGEKNTLCLHDHFPFQAGIRKR